jgi:hypothetical protein
MFLFCLGKKMVLFFVDAYVYLVKEGNGYAVTKGVVENSMERGLVYSIRPNLKPNS